MHLKFVVYGQALSIVHFTLQFDSQNTHAKNKLANKSRSLDQIKLETRVKSRLRARRHSNSMLRSPPIRIDFFIYKEKKLM